MGDYTTARPDSFPSSTTRSSLPSTAGLRQHCTDIIRFSHGARAAARRSTARRFIPGLHDVCMIFEKQS